MAAVARASQPARLRLIMVTAILILADLLAAATRAGSSTEELPVLTALRGLRHALAISLSRGTPPRDQGGTITCVCA